MSKDDPRWRRCSSCKRDIAFEVTYWVCNVSTCNRKRTGLVFCSVECWDAHLPSMRHRESWAEDRKAPSEVQWRRESQAAAAPRAPAQPRRSRDFPREAGASHLKPARPVTSSPALAPAELSSDFDREILVVASKLKKYIRDRSGMNTSDAVMLVLSDRIREIGDRAIRSAHAAERKTVLDRDIPES